MALNRKFRVIEGGPGSGSGASPGSESGASAELRLDGGAPPARPTAANDTTASSLSPTDADRLVRPPRARRSIFPEIVALSLIVHGALLAYGMYRSPWGEERAEGGTEDAIIIEGISIESPESVASAGVPSAAAVEETDKAEPVTEAEVAPIAETTDAAEVEDSAVAEVVPEAKARVDNDAAPVIPDDRPVTAAEMPPTRTLPDAIAQGETADTATPAREEPAMETPSEMAAAPSPDDRPAAQAETKAAAVPDKAVTAEDVPAKPAEDAPAAKPVDDAKVTATEVKPPPPEKAKTPTKPEKTAKTTSRPNKKAAANTAASAANSAAKGPTKGKAGAGGKTRDAQGTASMASYGSEARAHLRRYFDFPAEAQRRGLFGTAVVSFTLNASGRVISVKLIRSSGHAMLDRAALASVRRASPFPPIPKGSGRSQVTISPAPLTYAPR